MQKYYKRLVSNKKYIGQFIKCLFLFWVVYGCNPAKYVPEGKYLLKGHEIKIDNKEIDRHELENYLKQKPNKKILGYRFHLHLYNLSNIEKNNGVNRYLRKIGEKPVILDSYLARKSSDQIKLYLKNKGYYQANVSDTIIYKGKNAQAVYLVYSNKPMLINSITYKIDDSLIAAVVIPDTINTLIKKDGNFDVDVLQGERKRIESKLKSRGFYDFNKQYIYFEADTSSAKNRVDLTIGIKNYAFYGPDGIIQNANHKIYKINNIYLNPGYRAKTSETTLAQLFDTLAYNNVNFLYHDSIRFNKSILSESVYIEKNQLYNPYGINRTYSHLSSLKLYKLVDIQFRKIGDIDYSNPIDTGRLDCNINMTKAKSQSYSVEIEGTNSSGNLGAATNLVYQHNNLFRGFEELNVKLHGAFESLTRQENLESKNAYEFGLEGRVNIHKFWLPFPSEQFIKKYNPKTTLSLSYNYQDRPNYSGTIGNFEFGYLWQGNPKLTHLLNPFEFNIVNIKKDTAFERQIKDTYLEYSYQNHVVPVSSYTVTFNNQNFRKLSNSIFFRFKIESAGNLLWAANAISSNNPKGEYQFLGTKFSQFVKSDFEIRFYDYIDENRKLASRFFFGIGIPYGNSQALPFEKKYFSGGANSLRAWKMRTVGPGSHDNTQDIDKIYPNQTADLKLEGNIEYRFKMMWILEGALFFDAGNIWAVSSYEEQTEGETETRKKIPEEQLFKLNRFYKDIAVGTGFGLRFDFSFFIVRTDLGLKLRDPIILEKNKWILANRDFERHDLNVTLGIGYPF